MLLLTEKIHYVLFAPISGFERKYFIIIQCEVLPI